MAYRPLTGIDKTGHHYYRPSEGPVSDIAARACNKPIDSHSDLVKANDADGIFGICNGNLDCAQDFTDLAERISSDPDSFPLKPLMPVDFSSALSGVCGVELSADARYRIERARLCKKTFRASSGSPTSTKDLIVEGTADDYCKTYYGSAGARASTVRSALPTGTSIRALKCIMDEVELQ
jgi:hypothetical protein